MKRIIVASLLALAATAPAYAGWLKDEKPCGGKCGPINQQQAAWWNRNQGYNPPSEARPVSTTSSYSYKSSYSYSWWYTPPVYTRPCNPFSPNCNY